MNEPRSMASRWRWITRIRRRQVVGTALGLGFAFALLLALFGGHRGNPHGDDLLRRQVEASLTLHRALMPFDIVVDAAHGQVVLSGSVDTAMERELAARLARGISGVVSVDNRLLVEPDRARWLGRHSAMAGGLDDHALAIAVRAQLHGNDATRSLVTDVSSSAGTVVLRGIAANARVRAAAERIAARTHGVVSVDNRLRLSGGGTPRAHGLSATFHALHDGWLETRVRAALLYGSNVDGLDLDVRVDDGVVALRGLVASRTEIDLAQEIVAGVGGVRAVDTSAVRISP